MLSLFSHLHDSYNSCRYIIATHIFCLLVQLLSRFGSGEKCKCCLWQIISLFLAWWFHMRCTFCYLFMHVVSMNGLASGILNFEYFGTHTGNARLWGWRHQPEIRSRHISVYVPGHSEHQDHASEAEEGLTGGMSVLARTTVQVWIDHCLHEYEQTDGIKFYILLTMHRVMIHGKWPTWCTILYHVFIFIFNSLHVSSTLCSSSGETDCVHTTSGNCRKRCTRHGHRHRVTVARGCIDTTCLSWWWARCARNM
jgi:hypothetical protein